MAMFITADEHYGHKNIIRYCERPFKNAKEQDRVLIENHNSVVGEGDMVYHLGDFSMMNKDEFVKLKKITNKLNGIHRLILGNHDQLTPGQYLSAGFDSVHTSLELQGIFLGHDPILFQFSDRLMMLCGHVHNWWRRCKDGPIINVGVDVWDYTPVLFEKALEAKP